MKCILLPILFLPILIMAQKEIPVKIKETNHGLYTGITDTSFANHHSPTGGQTKMHNIVFSVTTDTIPMVIGNDFGIEFIVECLKNKTIDLEIVWTLPSVLTNNNGDKFTKIYVNETRTTNEKTFTGYKFEENYELIPGIWKLQLFFKNQVIHEHLFYIK